MVPGVLRAHSLPSRTPTVPTTDWSLAILVTNLVVTAFMAGLIWFVQVVHYPLMARVGRDGFVAYETAHTRLTTLVVAPAMLVEAITAGLLLFWAPAGVAAWMTWTGAALVLLLWISTAAVQVPLHGRLSNGFDAAAHQRLVRSNWIRTAAWSARTAIMAWALFAATIAP